MPSVTFKLAISATEYTSYYSGSAHQVSCTSTDGRKVLFPAEKLVPFVSHNGIYGTFEIEFSADNRFVTMRKVR